MFKVCVWCFDVVQKTKPSRSAVLSWEMQDGPETSIPPLLLGPDAWLLVQLRCWFQYVARFDARCKALVNLYRVLLDVGGLDDMILHIFTLTQCLVLQTCRPKRWRNLIGSHFSCTKCGFHFVDQTICRFDDSSARFWFSKTHDAFCKGVIDWHFAGVHSQKMIF